MSTSGTWNFGSPQNEQIITDAYERCGILRSILTPERVVTALRSLNFSLLSWINRGLNLWTVKQGMISLTPNQSSYYLPNNGVDIMEATIRTSTRNLGGTAASSAGGVAAYAFDNNTATACTQTVANGNISYAWGINALYPISMVGVESATTITYTLVGEYSYDGATWTQAISIPAQTYVQTVISWFAVPVPVPANYFRIRETGGATLNIEELYFNSNIQDTIITRSSRSEYMAYPNKSQTGRPSTFYVDRQIAPVLYLWPTPDTLYNNLFYTYTQQIQDIGSMINSADVPPRFIEPLTSELAFRLSIKEKILDLAALLKQLSDEQFKYAAEEDRERVPLRIYGSYMQGWTQS